MTRIVRTHYCYKRPPRKRKPNPAALAMPKIIHAKTPKPGRVPARAQTKPEPAAPANDDRRSAVVTIRSRMRAPLAQAPDVTPEEHKQRGDAADELFREMKRRIAEKIRS